MATKYTVNDVMIAFDLKAKYCKHFTPKVSYRKTKNTINTLEPGDKNHHILVGKAYQLVKRMTEREASEKEMQRAVRYLYVCIDAAAYKLDYHKAYNTLDISELEDKYPAA